MPQNQSAVRSYGDKLVNVYTARQTGTAATPTLPGTSLATSVTSAVYSVGFIVDGRIEEGLDVQSTQKYGQGGTLIRTLRSQVNPTWQFACAQWDAVVSGLARPGVIGTQAVAGTAEVQTVTISGTPTGGTFTLTIPGFGSVNPAYNVTTSALASSLSTLLGYTVAVSGTAGSSYQLTFPAAQGDVPGIVADGSLLTGGTSPAASATTSTPGVNPIYQQALSTSMYTFANNRNFWLDFVDGAIVANSRRLYLPNGEVTRNGSSIAAVDEDWETPFTLTAYPDANGVFAYEWTSNPAFGPAAAFA